MRDIFGISFSDGALHVSKLSTLDNSSVAISVDSINFPFRYNADSFFSDENLSLLALRLSDYRAKKQIHDFNLHVSLPINFAYTKRIAIPLAEGEKIMQSQINWELSQYLPGQLADYKIIKVDTEFDLDSYKEVVMICIPASFLGRLKQLFAREDASLKKVSLDNFSLENYLNTYRLLDNSRNQVVFKIDNFNITTHLFLHGKHYLHFLDNLNDLKAQSAHENKVLEIAKDRYNQITNILDQLPVPNKDVLELFAYGAGYNEMICQVLSENFSEKIRSLPRANNPSSNEYRSGYIEAIGVILS